MANMSKLAQAKQIAAHNAEIKNDIETLAILLKEKKYITKEAQEILKKYLPVESDVSDSSSEENVIEENTSAGE